MFVELKLTDEQMADVNEYLATHGADTTDALILDIFNQISKQYVGPTKQKQYDEIYALKDGGLYYYEIGEILKSFDIPNEYGKKATPSKFYACIYLAAKETKSKRGTVARVYNSLVKGQIIKRMMENNVTLDDFSDARLLQIPNFGVGSLKIARLANEIYKRKLKQEAANANSEKEYK